VCPPDKIVATPVPPPMKTPEPPLIVSRHQSHSHVSVKYLRHNLRFIVTILLSFNVSGIFRKVFYRSDCYTIDDIYCRSAVVFLKETICMPTRILLVLCVVSDMSEMSESKVRDLDDPATVQQTVGTLQTTVKLQMTSVNILHSLTNPTEKIQTIVVNTLQLMTCTTATEH